MKNKRNTGRILRILLAGSVFLLLLAGILIPSWLPGVFRTQAAPDLLALFAQLSAGALAALTGILLMTLIAGRLYCSILCPLGILQDLLGHFHIGKYRYTPWKNKVRAPMAVFTIWAAVCGFMLPLILLLPSSNFVMICNNVFREIIQKTHDTVSFLPEPLTIHPAPGTQITGWAILLMLTVLVQWRGRIYCNTLCPVGAVLGLFAKKSYFRVSMDPDQCIRCGACEKVCKAGCIDSKQAMIHYDECVMCLNCLTVCKKDAISIVHTKPEPILFRRDRRIFLKDSSAAAACVILGSSGKILSEKMRDKEKSPIMPPGAGSLDRFTARCVGCGLCIGACTGHVLKASLTEYGLRGFQQPVLDPYRGACEFECNNCSQICPCGALRPLTKKEKQSTRIGIAKWEPSLCVAFIRDEDCGACAEHCPVGALSMEEIPGKKARIPQVDEALCIGCGACQNICPIRPEAAIAVQGVADQTNIEPVKKEKTQQKLQAEDDFPF